MSEAARRRHGDATERFWARVDKRGPDDCWPWLGSISAQGYGNKIKGGTTPHRMSYEITHGPIPPGYHVDHLCHDFRTCQLHNECPHRRCVNPRHLQAVTPRENALRSDCPPARNHRAAQGRS